MSGLNRERLKERYPDADHAHRHAASDEQQETHAEAQADLRDDEATVGRVEAVDGVVPAHSRKSGQDKRDQPDAHHCVHCLLLGVTQPEGEAHLTTITVRI